MHRWALSSTVYAKSTFIPDERTNAMLVTIAKTLYLRDSEQKTTLTPLTVVWQDLKWAKYNRISIILDVFEDIVCHCGPGVYGAGLALLCMIAREARFLSLATAHTGTGRLSQLYEYRSSKWVAVLLWGEEGKAATVRRLAPPSQKAVLSEKRWS